MLEIDYLTVAKQFANAKGQLPKDIHRLVKQAIKNVSAERNVPIRIMNKPGDFVERNGVKYYVTRKGCLCAI